MMDKPLNSISNHSMPTSAGANQPNLAEQLRQRRKEFNKSLIPESLSQQITESFRGSDTAQINSSIVQHLKKKEKSLDWNLAYKMVECLKPVYQGVCQAGEWVLEKATLFCFRQHQTNLLFKQQSNALVAEVEARNSE